MIETKEGDALEGFLGSLPFGLRGVLRETVGLSPAAAVLAVLLFTIVAAYLRLYSIFPYMPLYATRLLVSSTDLFYFAGAGTYWYCSSRAASRWPSAGR